MIIAPIKKKKKKFGAFLIHVKYCQVCKNEQITSWFPL